ncbi:MAG: class I SAM-dependent methyltransferase [Elusimicrobia bacterium]|nr:class I SAM-dependent methyltransferase [Elusimicrobiota bacterium]
MKIKADWLDSLHKLKKRETDAIFAECPEKLFGSGLELGAGDGYQSKLISKYVVKLVSSDYSAKRLGIKARGGENIIENGMEYTVCDAERPEESFDPGSFDFIFSSSLLEHLPHPGKALNGMGKIMKDDGIMIHCMPNSFWKLASFLMFYPNLIAEIVERIFTPGALAAIVRKRLKKAPSLLSVAKEFENNPKQMNSPERAGRYNWLWPTPHGAYKSHVKELFAFTKRRWIKEFEIAGFDVVDIVRGPVVSGYGLGFDRVRKILENLGFSSGFAYISVKKGRLSPFSRFFGGGGEKTDT